jgi:hypothetical protein
VAVARHYMMQAVPGQEKALEAILLSLAEMAGSTPGCLGAQPLRDAGNAARLGARSLYFAVGYSVVCAFNAQTGQLLWEYDPKVPPGSRSQIAWRMGDPRPRRKRRGNHGLVIDGSLCEAEGYGDQAAERLVALSSAFTFQGNRASSSAAVVASGRCS